MPENDPPRFDGYFPRKKHERGLTEAEEAKDRLRHAWPAFVLVGVGSVALVAAGIVLGFLNGAGPIAGAIAAVGGAAYLFLRYAGLIGGSSEE